MQMFVGIVFYFVWCLRLRSCLQVIILKLHLHLQRDWCEGRNWCRGFPRLTSNTEASFYLKSSFFQDYPYSSRSHPQASAPTPAGHEGGIWCQHLQQDWSLTWLSSGLKSPLTGDILSRMRSTGIVCCVLHSGLHRYWSLVFPGKSQACFCLTVLLLRLIITQAPLFQAAKRIRRGNPKLI